jgi:hypothetical protein
VSWKVVEEIVERSRAKHGTRLVLLAIGEKAHHDGVAFVEQGARKGREGRGESIAERAGLSVRQVERCVEAAGRLDELEVRAYRLGRVRLYCYRVIVGYLRDVPADHERLLLRFGIELERPFSSPEELRLPRPEREHVQTGQIVGSSAAGRDDDLSGRHEEDDPTSAPRRPDILAGDDPTSAPPHTRASEQARSNRTGPNTSLTSPPSKKAEGGEVPAAAAAGETAGDRTRELLEAFAEEVGRWPQSRGEWGGWGTAFKQLSDRGVTVDELRSRCRSYRRHLERQAQAHGKVFEGEVTPFGLTKQWLLVGAALERTFFALARWAHETSWRLDEEDARWVFEEAAANVTPKEREQLQRMIDDARASRVDAGADVLRWAQHQGWALDDREWQFELRQRTLKLGPEVRVRALEIRGEIREALARLQFGLDVGERVA